MPAPAAAVRLMNPRRVVVSYVSMPFLPSETREEKIQDYNACGHSELIPAVINKQN